LPRQFAASRSARCAPAPKTPPISAALGCAEHYRRNASNNEKVSQISEYFFNKIKTLAPVSSIRR
jgi:hypothetical protein